MCVSCISKQTQRARSRKVVVSGFSFWPVTGRIEWRVLLAVSDQTSDGEREVVDRKVLCVWVSACKRRGVRGLEGDATCMQMDEVLASVAETIKNFVVIYLVDITEVPDFNTMYEHYDPSTVMFFFRNKHIMIDLGTGNYNKIN